MQSKLGNLSVTTPNKTDGEKIRRTNTNKSAEVPERLGCGHSKRRPGGTTQPAGEPRAAGLERPGNGPRYLVRKDHRGACGGRVMAYKSVAVRCRCGSY